MTEPHASNLWKTAEPYVVPYALFGLLTFVADYVPAWRAEAYAIKVIVVAAALWHYRRNYCELRFRLNASSLAAVVIGVLVIALWVRLDPYYPQSSEELKALASGGFQVFEHADKAQGQFNPFESAGLLPPIIAIIFRVLGAVLVVPLFEELFWRSLVMRWLIKDDFRSVPLGAYSLVSFAVTAVAFGVTHHEWLAGILCGAIFGAFLIWRKDLFQLVLAHAVANLTLAIYVLTTGAWMYW